MKLRFRRWTKNPGIGGVLETPEDFVVREILHPKLLRKFQQQKYILLHIRKRGIPTAEALRRLKPYARGEIGLAGLKDKFSVSYQYFTVKNYTPCHLENPSVIHVSPCETWLSPGSLLGNEFEILLHGCDTRHMKVIGEVAEGIPNYFGSQRFGSKGNNHEIGKMMVKRSYKRALKLINEQYGKQLTNMRHVPKRRLKFFVNAYQSWLFNETLNRYVKHYDKPYFREAKIFGADTRIGKSVPDRILREIVTKEKIAARDFGFPDLRLSCRGGERSLFVRTSVSCTPTGTTVKLVFSLPKGSYATVLLNEICKKPFNSKEHTK
ncbi:MAG: tRNA pseudouridine(13) synthase TruD [Candidatus Aenigmarchaeota archaeon]|nr:tRNA pseudouridine(13) synthase TruD [Candidatus Aenigmarchaeota archaeon]